MNARISILGLAMVLGCAASIQRADAVPFNDLGVYGAGDSIASESGFLGSSDSDFYVIAFSDAVLLRGTLTSPGGDFDFYLYETTVTGGDAAAEGLVFFSDNVGNEAFANVALAADDYLLEVLNFGSSGPYDLSLATTAVPEPSTLVLAGVGLLVFALHRRRR